MQQRRLRPGDVLDDYCPRERRITDHAIVAMIDDNIKQTRCVVCDAEHEYKQGRVPAQRRKKAAPGLFGQVLEGLQPARLAAHSEVVDLHPPSEASIDVDDHISSDTEPIADAIAMTSLADSEPTVPVAVAAAPSVPAVSETTIDDDMPIREDGPVRRPLIRATLPRHEGQVTTTARVMPEFTVRQPGNGRGGHRPGGRRRGGGQQQQGQQAFGQSRFGRGGGGGGNRPHGSRGPGHGHGQSQGHGSNGRPRRGGKKR